MTDNLQRAMPSSRTSFRILIGSYVVVLLGLAAVAFVRMRTGTALSFFMEDPVSVADLPFYTGIFSNVGVVLWCASAAICLFVSAILGKVGNKLRGFFLFSGLLTTILLLDDLFLLHEDLFPEYLGVPQKLVLLCYGITAVAYVTHYRQVIVMPESRRLILALALFGLSVFFDVLPFGVPGHLLFEEGCKLLGIVSWFSYFTTEGFRHIAALSSRNIAEPAYPELQFSLLVEQEMKAVRPMVTPAQF